MYSKMITKIFSLILCAGMILAFTNDISLAAMGKRFKESEYKPHYQKNTKSISGEVSVIRPTYVGIITHKDEAKKEETEMVFLVDEDVAFKKKELAELQEGDQVKITYENITEPDPEDPKEDIFVQRVTKEIHFLRAKSTSLKSGKK